ncbi:unnamed protein product [Diatraea saccharalis]|uniref:Uncharacterized protein n=1 Tax=Diatraea saccharalis TaxID=40085 RepID=A0A9N9RFH5_9NEOP|nr:unnamed protein product [Diatraea saccharalis]
MSSQAHKRKHKNLTIKEKSDILDHLNRNESFSSLTNFADRSFHGDHSPSAAFVGEFEVDLCTADTILHFFSDTPFIDNGNVDTAWSQPVLPVVSFDLPKVPEGPKLPDTPKIPDAPKLPDTPKAPDAKTLQDLGKD